MGDLVAAVTAAGPDPQPAPTHVLIPLDVVNRVLVYLVTRPYAEVAEIIVQLKLSGDASFKAQQAEGAHPADARSAHGG